MKYGDLLPVPGMSDPLSELESRLATAEQPRQRLELLLLLARESKSQDPARSRAFAVDASRIAEDLADRQAHASALLAGASAARDAGEYEEAAAALTVAFADFTAAGDHRGAAHALLATGRVYYALGDLSTALEYFRQALTIEEEIGDRLGRARTLRRIGVLLNGAGDPLRGLEHCRKSLSLCSEVAEPRERARSLLACGAALRALGRLAESAGALDEAVDMLRAGDHPADLVVALRELALTLAGNGARERAASAWAEARDRSARLGLPAETARAWLGMGSLAIAAGDLEKADRACAEALAQALRAADDALRAESHEALALLCRVREDWSGALANLEQARELRESLRRAETAARLRAADLRARTAADGTVDHGQVRATALAKAYAELETLNASLRAADRAKTDLLAQLERRTFEDPQTGLCNRRYAEMRLTEEYQRAARHERPLSVAIVDIDGLRRINEDLSHAVGDQTLRTVGALVSQSVRSIDLVARYGSDQFVVIFPDTDEAGATQACEKIREVVQMHDWARIHRNLHVTVSAGITGEAGLASHEKMLTVAERMVATARRRGRNRVCAPDRR